MFVVVCVYIWACEVSEAGPPKLDPAERKRVHSRAYDNARREAKNHGLDDVALFIFESQISVRLLRLCDLMDMNLML